MKFNRKYLVYKIDDAKQALSPGGFKKLMELLGIIDTWRVCLGKKDNAYLVINTDEPYARQVAEIMVAHGHCAKAGDEDVIEVD